MLTQKQGRYFKTDGEHVTILELQGAPMGTNWAVSYSFSGKAEDYFLVEGTPAPALANVLNAIQQDIDAGDYNKINMVAVSNRVAVRLWLDKTLRHRDFSNVQEGESSEGVPYIILPEVTFGTHTFPLAIVPEQVVGSGNICTLDVNNHIVGAEQQYPALPEAKTHDVIDAEYTVGEP